MYTHDHMYALYFFLSFLYLSLILLPFTSAVTAQSTYVFFLIYLYMYILTQICILFNNSEIIHTFLKLAFLQRN